MTRAKQSKGVELKNLPVDVLLNIFVLAQEMRNSEHMPFGHPFGHEPCRSNGKKKCMMPLIGQNYKDAYNGVHATRNNASRLVKMSEYRKFGTLPHLTGSKMSKKYPGTRSAVRSRRKYNSLVAPRRSPSKV